MLILVPAAVLGAVYVYSRGQYIYGYIEDAEKRYYLTVFQREHQIVK